MPTFELPAYNLKAVVRQTGIKPDTLRAWERRYGLPQPERSEGHQRLYTPRDVKVIHWLIARQNEGLSIKRAVDLWRQIEQSGRDPLESVLLPPVRPAPPAVTAPATGALAALRARWLQACLAFDEQAAEQVLAQGFALYPPETVCLDLLQEGIAQVGRGWYQGQVTIQQEHFATALAVRRLEALLLSTPPPGRPGRILAACPPEEEHTFGLLLLTVLLRRRGWDVVYLGANVPAERLEATVAQARPSLVILAAQRLQTAAGLIDMARPLYRLGVPLAFGGLVFNLLPGLRDRVPGYFLGERLAQAPDTVEALMPHPGLPPGGDRDGRQEAQARDRYLEQQPLIEAAVAQAMKPSGLPRDSLARANRELADGIAAALALGDIGFLGSDLSWLVGLLRHHSQPVELLASYLQAYEAAVREHLGAAGAEVADWLAGLVKD